MAQMTILYWRDIPTQIIVKRGRVSEKRPLHERFMEAVDSAAMRAGMAETDDYLEQWRKSPPIECEGDLKEIAETHAQRLESEYTREKLIDIVKNGGVLNKNE